jgi:anti-sigma factor RsiW
MAIDTEPCLSFGEDLSALLDGELEAGREEQVRAHLAACEACRAHLASLGSVNAGLRALVGRPVPANLEARLRARIAAERENGAAQLASIVRSRPPAVRRLGATFGAVALAAAAALALYLGVVRNRGPVEAPSIVQAPVPESPHGQQSAVSQIAKSAPASERGTEPAPELDDASDEDLGVAVELDNLEDLDDLDVIANLPVLERMDTGRNGAG